MAEIKKGEKVTVNLDLEAGLYFLNRDCETRYARMGGIYKDIEAERETLYKDWYENVFFKNLTEQVKKQLNLKPINEGRLGV